ncbi:MAG: hypothetical protein H7124_00620, partial [Phycisphaerales bacterium]|nr:hypothetical protein [Hyphomonadaceae bacterium]
MRTVSALRVETSAGEAVERLSDRALRAAAANPDHSQVARGAIAAAMSARRIAPAPWRVAVRGFIGGEDLARGETLFFGWAQRARLSLLVLARLGTLIFAASAAGRGMGADIDLRVLLVSGAATLAASALWLMAATLQRRPARVFIVGGGGEAAVG